MRVAVIVICGISLLSLINGYTLKCSKCTKNECECKRKILKAAILDPPDFESTKQCEESKPTDLKPVKDVCSGVDVTDVRPSLRDTDDPKFAPSKSCECGYDESDPPQKKYPADAISQYLAALAARRKTISETDLYNHGTPVKASPSPKAGNPIPEELLYKLNRQPIELQPAKQKYDPKDPFEEEQYPCNPQVQYYSDICYGKTDPSNPKFEQIQPEDVPCQEAPEVDELSTECPETDEQCDTDEETPDDDEDEEDCSSPEDEDCSSPEDSPEEEDEYRKRSIRLPVNAAKRRNPPKWNF